MQTFKRSQLFLGNCETFEQILQSECEIFQGVRSSEQMSSLSVMQKSCKWTMFLGEAQNFLTECFASESKVTIFFLSEQHFASERKVYGNANVLQPITTFLGETQNFWEQISQSEGEVFIRNAEVLQANAKFIGENVERLLKKNLQKKKYSYGVLFYAKC